ncbi:MAG TPA: GAF domain-containing protein [Pyrinomonadaceae bacterium]
MIDESATFDLIGTINELSQIPLLSKSRAEALKGIARLAKEALGSRVCTLVFVDGKNKTLTHAACAGLDDKLENFLLNRKIKMGASEKGYFLNAELLSEGEGGERYNLQEDGQGIVNPKIAKKYDFNSLLSEPLVSEEDGFIGYFTHFSSKNVEFTEDDRKLAKIFSHQALLTIERFDYLQILDHSLRILSDLSHSLLSEPPEEFLNQVPVKAAELLRVPVCIVWKLNKEENRLQIIAATENVDGDYRKIELNRDDPGIRKHLARGRVSYLKDVGTSSPEYFRHDTEASRRGWHSLLTVPMWSENDLIGMIDVYTDYVRDFKKREKEFFESFANQAALSIQKTDLLRKTEMLEIIRQLRKREKIIEEVQRAVGNFNGDDKIPGGEQLGDVLNLITQQCATALGADTCFLHLWNKSNDILELRSRYEEPPQASSDGIQDFKVGEGLIGIVAQEGESRTCNDTLNDPECSDMGHVSYVSSLLCVPLKSGEAVIGTISVGSGQVGAFGRDEQELLEGIADSLLNAIGRTNLTDNLLKLAQASHEVDSLDALCQRLAELTRDLMWEPVSVVWIIDKNRNGFAIRGMVTPEGQTVNPQTLFISQKKKETEKGAVDVIGEFLRRTTPLFLEDAARDEGHPYRDQLDHLDWKSMLAMPLVVKNRVIGILEVYSYKQKRTFTGWHQKLFGSWVIQASIAIGNVRARTRLQELGKITRRMAETNKVDKLFEMALDSALELVRSNRGWISHLDPVLGTLDFDVIRGEPDTREPIMMGAGITGKALELETSILVEDVSVEKWRNTYAEYWADTVSELAVPIVIKNAEARVGTKVESRTKPIGVINVESPARGAFYEADQESLEALARMAAIMIERLDLDRKLRELTDIETEIVGKSFDETIRKVTDGIKETLGFDYVNVSLVIPELNCIRTEYITGIPEEEKEDFKALANHSLNDKDIQAYIYREKTIEVPGEKDDRFDEKIYKRFGHRDMVRVFIPMINPADDRVIGTVEAGYRKTKYRKYIYEQDVQILQGFLNYAVHALENRDRERIQIICHEFRAPTVGIIGNSNFLQRRINKLPAEMIERKFQDIEMDCAMIFNQVNELQYILTGVPPAREPEPTLVMRDIVIKTVKQLRPLIIDYGLDFNKVEYHQSDITKIGELIVDKPRLNQVVFNLLMNSIKYSEDNPNLFTIRILTEQTPSSYIIVFKDWGIGIEKGLEEKVFERGFRTQEARKIDVTGSGLGLTLAREIMRGMKGDLILANNRKPTEFHVVLPKSLRGNSK